MLARQPIDVLGHLPGDIPPMGLCCGRPDRQQAEAGIRRSYRRGDLPPPRVVWCDGPLQLAMSLAHAVPGRHIGTNVKASICDPGDSAKHPRIRAVSPPNNLTAAVTAVVNVMATRVLHRRATRLRHALRRGPSILPRKDFGEISIGPVEFSTLPDLARFEGLHLVGNNAGWIVPHERQCWVAEQPVSLRYDAQGRLHSAAGPALKCRDGWMAWAWKGVPVPAWIIERPELISLASIERELDRSVRRCMIEIMTPERYVRAGGARPVASDEAGTLWRADWTYRGAPWGSWSAVEVEDGSVTCNGNRKRYFLPVPSHVGSPLEAVAWTYGMTASQYVDLDLRT
jgi:hypothetical protein